MPKKILVAPLDWGLGHATRSIPVINEFLNQGCEVQIASSGDALVLLKQEFSEVKFHELISYRAVYSSWMPFMLKILLQLPKFLLAIKKEHQQIERIIEAEKIDAVVSDNRYGCWSVQVPSVLIIHQVHLITPFFGSIINRSHESAMKKFSHCWVPDVEGDESLAGKLSINDRIKINYVGILSRMTPQRLPKKYRILAIISGPEPQRSIFESIIRRELIKFKGTFFIVLGNPSQNYFNNPETEANHVKATALNKLIEESELVISRSGYSTIMDLAALGKKVVFVPTPGQPEQEYLATRFMEKKIAYCMPQSKFDLSEAMNESKKYKGFEMHEPRTALSNTIKSLINEMD